MKSVELRVKRAKLKIENGEWKMNVMVKYCVGGQWPPLRLCVCKSFDAVRRVGAPYGNTRYRIKFEGAVCGHQANELRDTVMSRLRRVADMCSSKSSVNCEKAEKDTQR